MKSYNKNKKVALRLKRHRRITLRVQGTAKIPRLVVHRSLKNISGQLIDDIEHKTIFSLSTKDKKVKKDFSYGGNAKSAQHLGEIFAKSAIEKGVSSIVFDRAGYLYHGRIKAFADALRKGGLKF
jgi:large subunit ribosomal protein L18